MKILFDQGTPVPLRQSLFPHEIATAYELNWSELTNGDLLSAAEDNGFDVLITTDQNLQYQQNLSGRKISIIALSTTAWPRIKNETASISEALNSVQPGSYARIEIA